ncbi:hypothetical protein [Trichormus variabilis]|uniref:DNA-directed DNA polymerase n=1 Tax=Trichormus variabilis NIES-23 TaxID=1973479 RepID=A0A1Z4KXQ3_ANAVA|nr:hypothetical protein [Trichormus variabilis]MBD2352838.1 hypothetical protein [Trichormus variabilis FACHB-171]BAY73583.1 hypothetical protein NIES23_64350 [Trichormus variabilis NIES-23]
MKTITENVTTFQPLFIFTPPNQDQYIFNYNKVLPWSELDAFKIDDEGNLSNAKDVHFPFVADTEFYHQFSSNLRQGKRIGLSTQIRGLLPESPSKIYLHHHHASELNSARVKANLKPLPLVDHDFHFIPYLQDCGYDATIVKIDSDEKQGLPAFYATMFAHFAVAELMLVHEGGVKREIKNAVKNKVITSRRRMIIENMVNVQGFDKKSKAKTNELAKLDWYEFENYAIILNDVKYVIRLRIVDTCALHGVSSYKDIAESVGIHLAYKDNFTPQQKGDMLNTAIQYPLEFEQYSLGDLQVSDILYANKEKWEELYNLLELKDYFKTPKLTIGGTVKNLFLAALAKRLGITGKEWEKDLKERVLEKYMFNPEITRQLIKETRCLLTKVEGGRCRNNRPKTVSSVGKIDKDGYFTNLWYDIDISGCYGEGQRNQLFPVGMPEIRGLRIAPNNKYTTLREWLTEYGVNIDKLTKGDLQDWRDVGNWGELVAGLWYARIRTSERLKYSQDLITSWFSLGGHGLDLMAKYIQQNLSDTELADSSQINFDEEVGNTKIFHYEIHNGVLTHDILQWILRTASKRQREELLDKIEILTSAVYLRSQRIDVNIDELELAYIGWDGVNTETKIGGKLVETYNQCHKWFAVNLGELIVNDLLIQRKKAQINYGKKSPLDILFKLCVNTLYGDMVSKFFITSNPVVGNNITARARCLAWYMEKGFNGAQSITDGCGFELNAILTNRENRRGRGIDGELTIINRDDKLAKGDIKAVSLTGNPIKARWVDNPKYDGIDKTKPKYIPEILSGDNLITMSDIDSLAMEHLQKTFDFVDILHAETTSIKITENLEVEFKPRKGQFSFEGKDLYHSAGFHGSANYIFENPNFRSIKMRGYELKRTHTGWIVTDENLETIERYNDKNSPAKDFMNQLLDNPERIIRQHPAIKHGILKTGDYATHPAKFDTLHLEVGDDLQKPVLLQEFSLTQHTFPDYKTYASWMKEIGKAKLNDFQSLEGFALNPDASLNFIELTNLVFDLIANETASPFKKLDPSRNKTRSDERSKARRKYNSKLISVTHPHKTSLLKMRESLKIYDEE